MSVKYKKHSSNPFIDDELLIYRDDEKRVTTKKWYRKKVKSKREIKNPKSKEMRQKSGRWKGLRNSHVDGYFSCKSKPY